MGAGGFLVGFLVLLVLVGIGVFVYFQFFRESEDDEEAQKNKKEEEAKKKKEEENKKKKAEAAAKNNNKKETAAEKENAAKNGTGANNKNNSEKRAAPKIKGGDQRLKRITVQVKAGECANCGGLDLYLMSGPPLNIDRKIASVFNDGQQTGLAVVYPESSPATFQDFLDSKPFLMTTSDNEFSLSEAKIQVQTTEGRTAWTSTPSLMSGKTPTWRKKDQHISLVLPTTAPSATNTKNSGMDAKLIKKLKITPTVEKGCQGDCGGRDLRIGSDSLGIEVVIAPGYFTPKEDPSVDILSPGFTYGDLRRAALANDLYLFSPFAGDQFSLEKVALAIDFEDGSPQKKIEQKIAKDWRKQYDRVPINAF